LKLDAQIRRLVVIAFAIAAVTIYWACAIYDKSLLVSAEAGVDAAVIPSDSGADADPCDHARIPARPDHDDPGGVDAGELVFASRSLIFDIDAGNGQTVGFDLDGFCTCPGPPSCNGPAKTVCDDPRGRDNAAGALLNNFSAYADAFNPQKVNERIAAGRIGLVIRISAYNGTPNDTQIQAAVFLSNGIDGYQDGGTPKPPQYMGNDVWTIDPKSLVGGVAPPYIPTSDNSDNTAYVKDGVAVASLNDIFIDFAGGVGASQLRVDLTGVIVTANITPNGNGGFQISEGTLAGRWPTRKLLTSFAGIHDPLSMNPNAYLCGDSGTYAGLKSLACNQRDVASVVQNDGQNARCDALSFALRFTTSAARLGAVYSGVPLTQPCGPQWTDDCP
jgi:hypothetical protein